jgi:hypothetical protein
MWKDIVTPGPRDGRRPTCLQAERRSWLSEQQRFDNPNCIQKGYSRERDASPCGPSAQMLQGMRLNSELCFRQVVV